MSSLPANLREKQLEHSVWASFWLALTRFQRDKVTPWLALRNTLGVAIPLLAGVALGQVPAGLALATGALNVSYSDSHDPYSQRARKMLAASALVGLAVFYGALIGAHHTLSVLAAGTFAFAAGLLVALSASAADLGVITLVTFLVYSTVPQPPERAIYAGLLALAGGLFQTFLALALWPLRRYAPERRALGAFYLELSRAAASPVQVRLAPPASAQSTKAQQALASLQSDHSTSAERCLMLLSQAERMRIAQLTLGRLRVRIERERPNGSEGAIVDRFFAAASRALLALGNSLNTGEPAHIGPDCLRAIDTLADEVGTLKPPADSALITALLADARRQMDALAGQIRSAVELTVSATPDGLDAFERRESVRRWSLRLAGTFATLRANLNLDSAAFRHAVRLGACVALGDAFARGANLQRSYWVPMTVAIVLKPDFTATFSRGVLRLAGTFAGLILSTLLFHVLPPSLFAQVALIAVFMFVLRWLGSANYGIFVTAITALVVVLIAITGVAPKDVVAARAIGTVAGGVIALVAYGLWPTWERTQVPEAMARMLDGYRDYFRVIQQAYLDPDRSFADTLDRTRLASRLTRSNLEASIDRLSAEPGTPTESIGLLTGILASSHRMVHAMMALEAGLETSRAVPARQEFRPFANSVELTLYLLAAILRGSPVKLDELPDVREAHRALTHSLVSWTDRHQLVNVETDRITNSLNTLSRELTVWIAARK